MPTSARSSAPASGPDRARLPVPPPRHRRTALVVAAVVAVLGAVLAAWMLPGDGRREAGPVTSDGTTVTTSPTRAGTRAAPTTGRAVAVGGVPLPAASSEAGPGPVAGSAPVLSANPSRPASPSGGGTTAPSSPAGVASPSPSAVVSGKRLSSPGGAVYATCAKGKATLADPEPAAGYTVQRIDERPALAPAVVFKGLVNRYQIRVTCVAGQPTPVVLPL